MEFTDFLNLDYIKSFMGTVVVTMLVIQFLKEMPGIKKIKTKYFTFIVAFLNLLICSLLTNTFTKSGLYLMLINSILITFTACGGYDFAIKKVNVNVEKETPPKKIEPTKFTNSHPLD